MLQGHPSRPAMPWGDLGRRSPGLEAAAFAGALALEAKEQAMSKEIRLNLGAWVVIFERGEMQFHGGSRWGGFRIFRMRNQRILGCV